MERCGFVRRNPAPTDAILPKTRCSCSGVSVGCLSRLLLLRTMGDEGKASCEICKKFKSLH
eukprot:765804-Hanusia_phi.AAC.2